MVLQVEDILIRGGAVDPRLLFLQSANLSGIRSLTLDGVSGLQQFDDQALSTVLMNVHSLSILNMKSFDSIDNIRTVGSSNRYTITIVVL